MFPGLFPGLTLATPKNWAFSAPKLLIAVAESFHGSLKKERIKRYIYASRQEAKADVFD